MSVAAAALQILHYPAPQLRRRAEPVDEIDASVQAVAARMIALMREANGLGLAAPQVGVLKRVIVVDITKKDEARRPYCLVNPELLWVSDEAISNEEGCLSLPEHYAEVVRPAAIRVRYLDREGEVRELDAEGLLATCIQHEMDHLEGILFVDHLSALKRNMILRKLVKAKKAGKAPAPAAAAKAM